MFPVPPLRTALAAVLLAGASLSLGAAAPALPRPDTYQCGWFSYEPLPAEGVVQAPPEAKGACGLR
ncbi:hypothetical protein G3I76_39915 [Streptomyces sp. SID11233]|uniref:hypothetical protein n=1 Tax=Streptomyces sp. SID11385 TaxID=2706031 RepID=UPI0013C1765E|nr:hypothetical protein [Streptomyces sp. SID11385]NEA43210.1 hypothetical protein [Streptomyces sp. SID11385]NED86242.1 hypothetical protein [Streptomyces sp. SID11233]